MHPVEVLLPIPLHKSFTYLCEYTVPGTLVNVPWRSAQAIGIVLGPSSSLPEGIVLKTANPLYVSDGFPLALSPHLLSFIQKVAEYTYTPSGLIFKMILSGSDFKKWEDSTLLKNKSCLYSPKLSPLDADQERAFCEIAKFQTPTQYQSFLLEGVTGSGKTEVYFYALEKALQEKKQALVMIPEIGLTQSWIKRFEERFGRAPLFWHSDQTAKNKRQIWQTAFEGLPHIFVGTRSSLFLPYTNLGLIVVDEEHDTSYKQEEQVIYNARDMAILKAHLENFPIILASATPCLESLYNAQQGKSSLIKLASRYNNASLPHIHIVDKRKDTKRGWISSTLGEEITKRLEKQEQSLLFLNRKGFAPLTFCKGCGHRFECPGCSITLIQHKTKSGQQLRCHHCHFHTPLPSTCPACDGKESLIAVGPGVDRVHEEVLQKFPHARTITLTSDMSIKEQTIAWESIHKGEADIIIGTQLLAKGHHIPNLTLVGVVDADMGLFGADLRASERTFQLLQQVAGRAGREEKKGEVFLQTYQPGHSLFHALITYDQDAFVQYELSMRESLNFPPFGKMASILLSSMNEGNVQQFSRTLARHLDQGTSLDILGPAPALLARIKSRYRYRILIKGQKNFPFGKWLHKNLAPIKVPGSIQIITDVDPLNFF